jgi:acetylornithine aminotransferase
VNVPPEAYLRQLRGLCDQKGLLLILDEVQVGMGRTGTLFAHQRDGIRPDIVTLAKALGGGLPIGVMLTTEAIGRALDTGTHGSTFGGNPLPCAAGIAVLQALLQDGILENCQTMGRRFRERLDGLRAELPMIRDVRGRGLILGIELDRPGRPLVAAALERGLVINCTADKVIRLLPPLTISAAEVDEGLGILEDLLRNAP